MTDEFDSQQWGNLPGTILIIALFLLLGLVLEYGLRRLDALAEARGWRKTRIVLYALRGQALFWTVLLGSSWSLPSRWLNFFSLSLGLNFITFLIQIAATLLVVRLLTGWIELFAVRRNLQSLSLIRGLLNGFTFLVVLSVVLASLGVPIEGLLIALAGSSVVLSLALQQPLSNLFSGVMLAASNRFKPGDYIRLSTGEEGYVADVDWLTTSIQQMENNLVVIPNAMMTSAILVNFDRPDHELLVLVNVAVSRDQAIDRVEQITLEVARQVMADVPGGVPTWQPFIRYPQGLADYITRFAVGLRVKNYEAQFPVIYEFFRRLQERYQQAGITVPFPLTAQSGLEPAKLSKAAPDHSGEQPEVETL